MVDRIDAPDRLSQCRFDKGDTLVVLARALRCHLTVPVGSNPPSLKEDGPPNDGGLTLYIPSIGSSFG